MVVKVLSSFQCWRCWTLQVIALGGFAHVGVGAFGKPHSFGVGRQHLLGDSSNSTGSSVEAASARFLWQCSCNWIHSPGVVAFGKSSESGLGRNLGDWAGPRGTLLIKSRNFCRLQPSGMLYWQMIRDDIGSFLLTFAAMPRVIPRHVRVASYVLAVLVMCHQCGVDYCLLFI